MWYWGSNWDYAKFAYTLNPCAISLPSVCLYFYYCYIVIFKFTDVYVRNINNIARKGVLGLNSLL